MTPYLTRKRTSSTATAEETQTKKKIGVSKMKSKTKQSTNETSTMKDYAKVINTRSRIQTRKTKNVKDMSVSQDENIIQKEQETSMKHKKLSEKDNKTRTKKNLTHSNKNVNKEETKGKKKITKRVNKNASNSRQMSLKESFLNHSKIRSLRSNKNFKNSKNSPTLANESPIKKSNNKKKRQPIYECVSPENSKECTNEIYEFKFDINDSKERLPKKRKRKVTVKKIITNKKKKNVNLECNFQEEKICEKAPVTNKLEKIREKDESNVEPVQNEIPTKSLPKTENLIENSEKNVVEKKEPKETEEVKEQIEDTKNSKPTIVLVENFNDRKILIENVSQMSNTADFKLFRPTNMFTTKLIQQKNAINSSLFEKSLSPIKKLSENLQVTSPWRVSPLLTFSQVKNAFQSTPQNKKLNILSKNFVRPANNESKQYGSIGKARNNLQKNNENISTENHTISTQKKKSTLTLRKFGTEITNIDHSLHANLVEHVNEQVAMENINTESNVQSFTSNVSDSIKFDNNENKTNNTLTPNMSLKIERKEKKSQNHQKAMLNVQADEQKENFDPQPGPSGLQMLPLSNEKRALRQSNLNNFLNIMEMPQSTTIRTSHGLFDDGQSLALGNRSVVKLNESNMEIKNAFGFNDEDSNQDTSPIEHKITNEKKEEKKSTRLSIGDIKNKLLVKKFKETIVNEMKELKKSPIKKRNKQRIIDITNFSDTFDVLSETNETSVMNESEIPLFADMEPSHFTTPPRYSYKRKRAVRFSFSEDSEGEEEEVFVKHEKKRNKNDKLKKEQNKRLMEWVQNINRTFSEIDQHELMIV